MRFKFTLTTLAFCIVINIFAQTDSSTNTKKAKTTSKDSGLKVASKKPVDNIVEASVTELRASDAEKKAKIALDAEKKAAASKAASETDPADKTKSQTRAIDSVDAADKVSDAKVAAAKLAGQNSKDSTKSSPNTILSNFAFTTFSDIKGLNPNQPNSLIQTQFLFYWKLPKIISTFQMFSDSIYFFHNLILPIINIFQIKSDSAFQFVPVHYIRSGDSLKGKPIESSRNIATVNILKYATFTASGKLNVVTFENKDKSVLIYGDLYGIFVATKVYDSLLWVDPKNGLTKAQSYYQIYSAGVGSNIKIRFEPKNSPFMMDVYWTSFNLDILGSNNGLQQNYGAFNSPDNNPSNDYSQNVNLYRPNKFFSGIQEFGFQIAYHGPVKKDSTTNSPNKTNELNNVFFRVNFFSNPYGINPIKDENNYIQIQLGLSESIDNLFSFLKGV